MKITSQFRIMAVTERGERYSTTLTDIDGKPLSEVEHQEAAKVIVTTPTAFAVDDQLILVVQAWVETRTVADSGWVPV